VIALYMGISPLSRMIRWTNFSKYSHASYVDEDELTEFESAIPDGVREKTFLANHTPGTLVDLFDVNLSAGELEGLREFFRSEKGQPYDYRGLFGFLARRQIEDPEAWFCSELVFAGFMSVKKPLLLRLEAFKTYPALLSYSPLLKYRKTVVIGKEAPGEVTETVVHRARSLGVL